MSKEEAPKKSPRLKPAEWAKACALWESGEVTLKDLHEEFGMTVEAFSRKFKREGIERGVKAHEHADKIRDEMGKVLRGDAKVHAERVSQAKEDYFNWFYGLGRMTMHEIVKAGKEKRAVATTLPNLKALEKAAQVMKISREQVWPVLGLDKDDDVDFDDFPDLPITEMTAQDIEAIQRKQLDEALGISGDTDPILEGEDYDEDDVVTEE